MSLISITKTLKDHLKVPDKRVELDSQSNPIFPLAQQTLSSEFIDIHVHA